VFGGHVPPIVVDLAPRRPKHLAGSRATSEQQQFQGARRCLRVVSQLSIEERQVPPRHRWSGPNGRRYTGKHPQDVAARIGTAEPTGIDRHGMFDGLIDAPQAVTFFAVVRLHCTCSVWSALRWPKLEGDFVFNELNVVDAICCKLQVGCDFVADNDTPHRFSTIRILFNPSHISQQLAKDTIVAARYFQLNDNVTAVPINGADIDKAATDRKFDASYSLFFI
jgi:hypothetical protein